MTNPIFRHLISAMLYIGPEHDKGELVSRLYKEWGKCQDDPVDWIRKRFSGSKLYPQGIYLRKEFVARNYSECKP